MFLLSTLKKGDCFRFLEGQTALYLVNNNRACEYDTTDTSHVEFEVLKVNEKSIKVKPLYGRVEYIFKFKGYFNGYAQQGVDCTVEKVTPVQIEITSQYQYGKENR